MPSEQSEQPQDPSGAWQGAGAATGAAGEGPVCLQQELLRPALWPAAGRRAAPPEGAQWPGTSNRGLTRALGTQGGPEPGGQWEGAWSFRPESIKETLPTHPGVIGLGRIFARLLFPFSPQLALQLVLRRQGQRWGGAKINASNTHTQINASSVRTHSLSPPCPHTLAPAKE